MIDMSFSWRNVFRGVVTGFLGLIAFMVMFIGAIVWGVRTIEVLQVLYSPQTLEAVSYVGLVGIIVSVILGIERLRGK